MSTFRIFLSAVTSEFASVRDAVASDLRARGLEVKFQRDFRQEAGAGTTLQKLHDYIKDCDAVVCIVGERSGASPPPDATAPFTAMLPDGITEASYTQWEFIFAKHYGKRCSLYLAEGVPSDEGPSADEQPALQEAFVKRLKSKGLDRDHFSNKDALRAEILRETWPDHSRPKPNNLPYPSIGTLFVGREEFLKQLHESLSKYHQAAIKPRQAIHGLGGIGKTRLATEYAWQHQAEYTALLFVVAESREALHRNLAALCGPLVLDLPENDEREEEVKVAAALRWLQQHENWFLLVDNVDTSEAMAASEELLGRLAKGHVVYTSRLSNWGAHVRPLELDVLDEDVSTRFILERTEGRRRKEPDAETQARAIARDVDGLALALEQACAYIAQRRLTLAEYRSLWQEKHDEVLKWYDKQLMNYPKSVAITWQTSLDQLSGSAKELLMRLAWLSPEPIPETLLDLKAVEEDTLDARAALDELVNYSLVTRDNDGPYFSVHRLVQDVSRRAQGEDITALAQAAQWLNVICTGSAFDINTIKRIEPLVPHIEALCYRTEAEEGSTPIPRLLTYLAGYLDTGKALFIEAERAYRHALAIDEKRHGPDHPSVVIRLNNLALLLKRTARLADAEPMMRRALAIDEQRYGPENPRVAIALNNLANLLQAIDRLVEAEPMMRRALAIDEKSYGPEDPDVAVDLNNLASLLYATNRLVEAEPMIRRALAIDERSYGPEHPNVATDLNNLAQLLKDTDRLSEAEHMMRRVLAIDERNYGSQHPEVATDLNNLAGLLQTTDRLAVAEPMIRRALAIDERSYGPDHPHVARDLNNLAQLLKDTNRLAEAEPIMRRALSLDEKSYGPDHPKVARDLINLAGLLQATERLMDAEPMMRRALAIDEKSYGTEHPEVAIDLNNLATLLRDTDRLSDAEPMMRRAFQIFLQSVGPAHKSTTTVGRNYEGLLRAMNLDEKVIQARLEELDKGAQHQRNS